MQKNRTRRKRINWRSILKKVLFWVTLFAFVGTSLWVLFLSPFMRISSINVTNQRIDKQAITTLITQQIRGMYFSYIPKDNLLVVSKQGIEKALLQQFRLIKQVEIQRVFPNALLIRIEERKSTMAWCAAGECFLVDENGEAFFKLAPDDPELIGGQLVRVDDRSPNRIEIGRQIVSPAVADICQKYPDALAEQLGITTNRVLSTPSPMANEMRIQTTAGWELLWSTSIPLEQQISLLKQVLTQQLGSDTVGKLEYLDIRLKGKVIYRLKALPDESSETSQTEKEGQAAPADAKPAKPKKETSTRPPQG